MDKYGRRINTIMDDWSEVDRASMEFLVGAVAILSGIAGVVALLVWWL